MPPNSSLSAVNKSTSSTNRLSDILDYKTLMNYNQENVCEIFVTGSSELPIKGIIDPDQTSKFSVKATYKPLIDQSRFLEKVQDPINLGSAAWDNPQVMINSLRLSEKSFKGFEAGQDFSVKLSIPVMHPSDRPKELAYKILKYACGIRAGGGSGSSAGGGEQQIRAFGQDLAAEMILYAPNKYHIEYKSTGNSVLGPGGKNDIPQNTTTIRVGTRYLYTNVLVNSVVANFSDTVYHDGTPTWLDMTVNFEYWRQIDLNTFGDFLLVGGT